MKWDDIVNVIIELEKSNKLKDEQGRMLVSKEGLPIYSALEGDANDDVVSAICATILNISVGALKELACGDLKRIIIDGVDGIIILSKAGENAILCTLAKSDASLGMVFLNIQSVSKKISELLDDLDNNDDDKVE